MTIKNPNPESTVPLSSWNTLTEEQKVKFESPMDEELRKRSVWNGINRERDILRLSTYNRSTSNLSKFLEYIIAETAFIVEHRQYYEDIRWRIERWRRTQYKARFLDKFIFKLHQYFVMNQKPEGAGECWGKSYMEKVENWKETYKKDTKPSSKKLEPLAKVSDSLFK